MNENQTDELDVLLRQWRTPAAPPWLATRVLAEIRNEKAPEGGLSLWVQALRRALLPSVSLLCLACIVWTVTVYQSQSGKVEPVSMASLESALDVFAHYSDEVEPWSAGEVF